MNSISIKYVLKWCLKYDHKYQWSICGKSFNNGSIGYWIGRNFIILKNLRKYLELIPKEKTPF